MYIQRCTTRASANLETICRMSERMSERQQNSCGRQLKEEKRELRMPRDWTSSPSLLSHTVSSSPSRSSSLSLSLCLRFFTSAQRPLARRRRLPYALRLSFSYVPTPVASKVKCIFCMPTLFTFSCYQFI